MRGVQAIFLGLLASVAGQASSCWYDALCPYEEGTGQLLPIDIYFLEEQMVWCQEQCYDSPSCNHFTVHTYRGVPRCYQSLACEDSSMEDVCLELGTCNSGPKDCNPAEPTTEGSAEPTTDGPVEPSTPAPTSDCPNHNCIEDGLFQESPCGPTFCQCDHGDEHLMWCVNPLVFNPEFEVCDWPANNPECDQQY